MSDDVPGSAPHLCADARAVVARGEECMHATGRGPCGNDPVEPGSGDARGQRRAIGRWRKAVRRALIVQRRCALRATTRSGSRSRAAAAHPRTSPRASSDERVPAASRAAPAGETQERRRAARLPPYAGSPTSGCPIAARCTRIWCVRPVSSVQRSKRAPRRNARRRRRACAPACLLRRPPSSCAASDGGRSARRRSSRAQRRPARPQGIRASRVRAASWRTSSVCASGVLATTISPLVSLSRRCTMPARGSAGKCGMRDAAAH